MKVVDAGTMLPNGQAQGSSGLNNNPINGEAKAKVREQSVLDIFDSFLFLSSFFLHIVISHTFVFFSSLLLGSNSSIECGGQGKDAAQWKGSRHQWIEQQSHSGEGEGGGT
jgi:hypothetical protein